MNYKIIENLESKYCVVSLSFSCLLELLEKRYLKQEENQEDISECIDEFKLPVDVILPDKKYINGLIKELSKIKNILGEWESKSYEDGLKKILDDGDFDDAEEIMSSVHELIKKYIYGSDTKVSDSAWKKLEKHIEKAGYIPVAVKIGDDISQFKSFFDRPIPANGGVNNTIKQIQLKPYNLKFYDGEQVREELKLCGKCTYYK